jgi:prepilin-type N-terminal cleavage/methylation domain-containing protein
VRNKAFSVQRSAFGEKQKLFTDKRGVTLVELMITLVIFSIVISMIYSVFNAFIKQATSERKTAKTEMDVINVSWPLLKEIQTAGFGVPKTGTCTPAISESGGVLTIHSTAAGDSQYAGKWGFIGTGCALSTTDIPNGQNVVVINNTDRSRLGVTTVGAGNTLASCGTNEKNIAYWTPYVSGSDLECYETSYYIYNSGTAPAMCATGTFSLGRRVSTTAGGGNPDPVLDCVLDAAYRFGCISSAGALTWQTGTDCGTKKLRLVKVGMIVQNSTRRDFQVPDTITLFGDLSGQSRSVTVSSEQRYYKWRTVEQTILLKNLE